MSKKTIILDLDDTLGCLKSRLQEIYRRATGDNTISYNDWDNYGHPNRYGISSEQLSELFIEDNSLQLMKPFEGAVEVTALMKSRGFNVEIVTARGWHPDGYNVTKKWLDDNYISYDRINIVPLFQCKEEATRHIENVALFVDDRLDHCVNVYESGRIGKSLVLAQPWNRDYHDEHPNYNPNIIRIDNIYDVLNHTGD